MTCLFAPDDFARDMHYRLGFVRDMFSLGFASWSKS